MGKKVGQGSKERAVWKKLQNKRVIKEGTGKVIWR
jgi:hypothetical protein